MDRIKVAIPCVGDVFPQGQLSSHFGRCDSYAVVTVEEGKIRSIEQMSNRNQIDCGSSVRALAENGVSLVLVGSMGVRPYLAFKELGIEVRRGFTRTVAEAIESYLKGETLPLEQDDICNSHSSANEPHRRM